MDLEKSPKSHDRVQVKSLLPNFLNEIGSKFGLTAIEIPQPLSKFIADIGSRDSLVLDSNIESEPQHNVHKPNLRIIIDDLVKISDSNDDSFNGIQQELRRLYQLFRKQAQSPEHLDVLEKLKKSLDEKSFNVYKDRSERAIEKQKQDIQKYWEDYEIRQEKLNDFNEKLVLQQEKSKDLSKQLALQQQRDLVKKELDETNKAFYKGLSDHIENEIIGAEMELNSLQHYQLTLKFMLLVFDKGSMAFMSTMGAIDSLNMLLPAFANNLKNLQHYHSSSIRMMNKFSA